MKIRKSLIVLIISLLILIALLVVYFMGRANTERPLSPREQYQLQLEKENGN